MTTTFNEQAQASLTLLDKRSAAVVPMPTTLSPIQELQMQIVRAGDLDKLRELRAIEKEWREDQAKQAFVEAMAAFKQETIRITKDKDNRQYNSKYTSLGNLVTSVTPYLSKHGFSADWEIDQSNGIKVACVITHRLGHSKRVLMTVPLDTSGQKNPIQQIKSSITYAKICTFESACGLASTEGGNLDDDGNGAGQHSPAMNDDVADAYIASIQGSGDLDELKANYKAAQDAAEAAKDHNAARAFADAKNAMYRKLARAK